MSGAWMGGMGLVWMFVVVLHFLGFATLVKYLRFRIGEGVEGYR